MTTESAVRNLRQSGSVPAAAAVLFCLLCCLGPAVSQVTRSQRRLATGQVTLRPVDQIRLLLQLQQLTQTRSLAGARLPDAAGSSLGRWSRLAESLLQQKPGAHRSSSPSSHLQLPGPPQVLSDRRRLENELRTPAAEPRSDGQRSTTRRAEHASDPQWSRPEDRSQPQASEGIRSRRQPVGAPPARSKSGLESLMNSLDSDQAGQNFGEKRQHTRQGQNRPGGTKAGRDHSTFDIGRELSTRGLEQTFRRLVRDIRKNVRRQPSADGELQRPPPKNSTFDRAVAGMLETVRTHVVDITRNPAVREAVSSVDKDRDPSVAGDAGLQRARKERISTRQKTSSPDAASPPPAKPASDLKSVTVNDVLQQSPMPADSIIGQLLVILAGLIIAAIAYLSVARRKHLTLTARRSRAVDTLKPERIQTRDDVIRAFHRLTHCQTPDAAAWWNHRQAEASLMQHTNGRHQPLQDLTKLYEAARYHPADQTFDETHIQQARVALSGCLS